MAVYKPKRNGVASKNYVCEFVTQGKRFQESTGATSKTVAKEYEKQRKADLERAAAGLPTEKKSNRIKSVSDVVAITFPTESRHRDQRFRARRMFPHQSLSICRAA
jgi:hypothetical protein